MTEYFPDVEEIDLDDIDLHEAEPDSKVSPTHRVNAEDNQDDPEDDSAPAPAKKTAKKAPAKKTAKKAAKKAPAKKTARKAPAKKAAKKS